MSDQASHLGELLAVDPFRLEVTMLPAHLVTLNWGGVEVTVKCAEDDTAADLSQADAQSYMTTLTAAASEVLTKAVNARTVEPDKSSKPSSPPTTPPMHQTAKKSPA